MLYGFLQITFTTGIDGWPAYLFEKGANIRKPAKSFFRKNKLFRDFSLFVTIRPDQEEGGILFAVVPPAQTIISFGLELGQSLSGEANLTLYYTDHRYEAPFEPLAVFTVPS